MVMNRKLVIAKLNNKILTTMIENESVVELHCINQETQEESAALGNIYVGKVKNIVGNIGAAFVEIANGIECYYPLEENKSPLFTHKSTDSY